jgi:hypothetical protein
MPRMPEPTSHTGKSKPDKGSMAIETTKLLRSDHPRQYTLAKEHRNYGVSYIQTKTPMRVLTFLVKGMKHHKTTCMYIVDSCIGSLINSFIKPQPGTVAVYDTSPFLLNDDTLHQQLTKAFQEDQQGDANGAVKNDKDRYMESKLDWTRRTALAFQRANRDELLHCRGWSGDTNFSTSGPQY